PRPPALRGAHDHHPRRRAALHRPGLLGGAPVAAGPAGGGRAGRADGRGGGRAGRGGGRRAAGRRPGRGPAARGRHRDHLRRAAGRGGRRVRAPAPVRPAPRPAGPGPGPPRRPQPGACGGATRPTLWRNASTTWGPANWKVWRETPGWPSSSSGWAATHSPKEPCSWATASTTLAFSMVASTLARLRPIPGARRTRVTSLAVKAATILGSKSWKARRKPSRLASTVRQDRPAWKTSRLRRSNQPASPTGASPHSLSWEGGGTGWGAAQRQRFVPP